jgi:putative peptidoglycan lipid II flippase
VVLTVSEIDPPIAWNLRFRLQLILGALAAFNLIVAFIIQAAFLRLFGAGAATDAFVAAQATPTVVFTILGMSLVSVWQPILAVATGPERRRLAAHSLGQASLVLGLATLVLAVTAQLWTPLLFAGFDEPTTRLTVDLGRPLMLTLLFMGLSALLGGLARADGRFIVAEAIPLAASVLALAALLPASRWFGVEGAAWIWVLRTGGAFLALWLLLGAPLPNFAADPVKKMTRERSRPILFGSSLYKLSPLLDRFLASQGPAGGVALFNLAQMGGSAAATVVDRAIGAPLGPGLAVSWADGELARFRTSFRGGMALTWLPVLAMGVVLLLFSSLWHPLVGRALNLSPDQSALLFQLTVGLLGMIAAAACGAIAVAAFYALGDTRTPTAVGVVGFLLSIGFKVALFGQLGLVGLAWATSIYYLLNLLVMWLLLERKVAKHAAARG